MIAWIALALATLSLTLQLYRGYRYMATKAERDAAFQALKDEVSEAVTVKDSVIVLLRKLKEMIDAGIDNQDITVLTEMKTMLDTSNAELADAVTANTPAENPATPV